MRFRDAVAGVAALLVGLAVSGCDSTAAGSPTAATTLPDTTGETSSGGPSLAPPVEHPKDLRGIDPCELLTPDQLTELGVTVPGQEQTTELGEQGCFWPDPVVGIAFSPNTKLGEGLDRAYRNKNIFDNFEVTEVDGYPAVRVDFATQSCGLIVGVSDKQTLGMDYSRMSVKAPGQGDPCGFAERVAGMVLENLPDA